MAETAPQTVKPPAVTEPSVVHVIVAPGIMNTCEERVLEGVQRECEERV
jgi:hypothetical protein